MVMASGRADSAGDQPEATVPAYGPGPIRHGATACSGRTVRRDRRVTSLVEASEVGLAPR